MATRKKKAEKAGVDYEPAGLHDFVVVVEGDREGTYGVVIDTNNEGDFVIRSRDSNSDRFVVESTAVRKSEAGLR